MLRSSLFCGRRIAFLLFSFVCLISLISVAQQAAPPVVPDLQTASGLQELAGWLWSMAQHKQYFPLVSLVLIVVVEAVNQIGVAFAKARGWSRAVAFLQGDQWQLASVFLLSSLGALLASAVLGKPPSRDIFIAAGVVGLGAIGGHQGLTRFFWPMFQGLRRWVGLGPAPVAPGGFIKFRLLLGLVVVAFIFAVSFDLLTPAWADINTPAAKDGETTVPQCGFGHVLIGGVVSQRKALTICNEDPHAIRVATDSGVSATHGILLNGTSCMNELPGWIGIGKIDIYACSFNVGGSGAGAIHWQEGR